MPRRHREHAEPHDRVRIMTTDAPKKKSLSKPAKLLRLVGSMLDPRAYAHAIKIVNFYNYSHVQPLRAIALGSDPAISPDASFTNPERISIGDRVRIGSRCSLWAGPRDGRMSWAMMYCSGPRSS
jgi:acetyltransferase-like isoleucine patch superfamily enzyme